MTFSLIESIIRWAGGFLAFITLGFILSGIARGLRQPGGRSSGHSLPWLRSPWFYGISVLVFLVLCFLSWKRLPWTPSFWLRFWMQVIGSPLLFLGLGLVLWGRLALGRNYFVSLSSGAWLFSAHQLVTSGPYARLRHPMYVGLLLAALGSFLVYFTWTALCFAFFTPFVLLRTRHEEQVLAAEFGDTWREYCARVPPFFPRIFQAPRESR